jgi:DNA-binding transcriptional ArsR family regulator
MGRSDRRAQGTRGTAVGVTDQGRAGERVVDSVFVALADPTRRHLLALLGAEGELTATTLAARVPVSRQAVAKHLAALDAAGLVSGTRVGREVRYSVRPAALDATARWMAALAVDWDRRLAAIKRVAEAAERQSLPADDTQEETMTRPPLRRARVEK